MMLTSGPDGPDAFRELTVDRCWQRLDYMLSAGAAGCVVAGRLSEMLRRPALP